MGGLFGIATCRPRLCRSGGTGADTAGGGETGWWTGKDAGVVWSRVAICIVKKHVGSTSGTCTKQLSIGNLS